MAKLYTKNTWQDEVLSGPDRYITKTDGGTVIDDNIQIVLKTPVVQAGTTADAAKMNNIENGLDVVDTLLDDVANRRLLGLENTLAGHVDGRLTLTSGTPITTADVTGATTLYLAPFVGNRISLFDGTDWDIYSIGNGISLSLAGLLANTNYDIFCYANGSTPTLEALAWSNSGAGTSSRATALTRQDGALVKSGAPTRLFIGTIRTTGVVGQCEDSLAKRFVWNYQNRVLREFNKLKTNIHVYTNTGAFRAWDNDATVRVEFVCGEVADLAVHGIFTQLGGGMTSISLNSSTAQNHLDTLANDGANYIRSGISRSSLIGAGYHYLQAVELGAASASFASVQIRGAVYG